MVDASGNVTIKEAGTTTFTVSQMASDNYLEGSNDSITMTVEKQATTITGNNFTKIFGGVSFNLLTTEYIDSNNNESPYIFASSNDVVATVDTSGNVTIKEAGTTTFTVSQIESNNYLAGSNDSITMTVEKQATTITGNNFTKIFGGVSFNLLSAASISSNNNESLYTFTSSDNDVAMVDTSGNVTIKEAGTTTFTVSQIESDNYLAASNDSIEMTVEKQATTITGTIITKTFGDVSFNLLTTEYIVSNNNESPYIFVSSNDVVATVDTSGNVTIKEAGTTTFTV
jgi:acetolactate synthase regulatory subunit